MDIVAHTLWAGAGMAVLRRRKVLPRRTVVATLILAAMPDVLHLVPIAMWWIFADGTFAALLGYAMAVPGQEPWLPPWVQLWSHHLHCLTHSAPVAGLVTVLLWVARRAFWMPLLGWWLHVVIDVFTHSTDYYAVPVLYPFTQRGFDGIAWTTPWFMVLNYVDLAAVVGWLMLSHRHANDR